MQALGCRNRRGSSVIVVAEHDARLLKRRIMRKLVVFNSVTLDGYFKDANRDRSWAHSVNDDAEWNAFVADNASGGGQLLFGRITYELMASYWPTPYAIENDPIVAER